MIKPITKFEEHLQAQIEYFADKKVKEFSTTQKIILKNSSELAKIINLNNLPENLPKELKDIINENRDEYIQTLATLKKEDISFRKENAILYNNKFKSIIKSLKSKISSSKNPKELAEYLGSGSNGNAYVIEVDTKKYAAKFSNSSTQSNFEIKPLIQAKGIKNVAQLVSYSFADEVVIMELLQGTDVSNLSPKNAPEYSDKHIINLIQTVVELYNKWIMTDPKPSNFIYDEENGFSVLDFHLSNGNQSIGDLVIDLRFTLTTRKWPYLEYNTNNYDEKSKAQRLEKDKIYLPMMIKFLKILQVKFPEILNDWKIKYQKREEDPSIRQYPIINREYIQTEDPEIKKYLIKLEEMGF